MKRIALLIAVLTGGIGVGYLLFASKSPTAVVVSQSEPAKAKAVTPVTKKNNKPTGDLYVTGGIEAIGFGDSYIPQPESFSGGQVTADNTTTSNPTQPESAQ
ncbi:MAG: hypothetical protein RIQ72_541 [Candidatus Parcubacteria bacterium]|jgi:hypothetical protein